MDGWINLYKPKGISSAKAVAIVKRSFPQSKVGHTGTLDLEADGVLPIAVGEATKLVCFLMDAPKKYKFTIKFGAKTDTADSAGKIIAKTNHIPEPDECLDVCKDFTGTIKQIPPAYSALKIAGKRAYDLARRGEEVILSEREVTIYNLELVDYCLLKRSATYVCTCSKGTYIRSLAEDISLRLKTLGYVIELTRLSVGKFNLENSLDVANLLKSGIEHAMQLLCSKYSKIESVLDDIPVLEATDVQVQQIYFGQKVIFPEENDLDKTWVKGPNGKLIAIGSLYSERFKSSRVFNL
ncbi:MAG: tRNA pseudouridine(55) synthase TruB [Rickettsiaceae bacterium]|nr:tRNA pseudouridine(55) synthase TruB [Rickettsiaceae bacterium]